jgi:hypothetical protein
MTHIIMMMSDVVRRQDKDSVREFQKKEFRIPRVEFPLDFSSRHRWKYSNTIALRFII